MAKKEKKPLYIRTWLLMEKPMTQQEAMHKWEKASGALKILLASGRITEEHLEMAVGLATSTERF